jgi:hypothetical protein
VGVAYATRETVKAALDSATTAYDNARVDRAVEFASRQVESLTVRRFYPEIATRYRDWPNREYAEIQRLWLDGTFELISLTSLVSGGLTIAPANYFLRRADGLEEPPYTLLEINLGTATSFFSVGTTWQRSIALTGVFGYNLVTAPAGTLAAAITLTTATTCTVSDSASIGVGSLITIDTERLIVTGKASASVSTITADLATLNSANGVSVGNGALYVIGEVLTIGTERMLIVDITGNTLVVKRAYDGSTLAAHTNGDTVYAPRALTVQRGVLGTTAATHLISAPIVVQTYPGPVVSLTVAYALNELLQQGAGYARVAGTGDSQREFTGRGIAALERDAISSCGRRVRTAAV